MEDKQIDNAEEMQSNINRDKRAVFLVVLCGVSVLVGLFLSGSFFSTSSMTGRKWIMLAVAISSIVVLPIVCAFFLPLRKGIFVLLQNTRTRWQRVLDQKNRIGKYVLLYVGSVAVLVAGLLFGGRNLLGLHVTAYRVLLAVIIWLILFSVFLFRKTLVSRPEILFLIVVLLEGTLLLIVTPARPGVTWDDEVHYARTINIADTAMGAHYQADLYGIEQYQFQAVGDVWYGYSKETIEEYNALVERMYRDRDLVPFSPSVHDFSPKYWCYLPGAFGLYLGRGLQLPYAAVYALGRFMNLLCYGLLFFFAMRSLQGGKLLIAGLGMIPTSVFMAASYSYDWWVIGWAVLAYAKFFSYFQDPEKELTTGDMLLMLVGLAIGCFPKAIYFPLLFPMLFLPLRCFRNKKQMAIYWIILWGMVAALILSFAFPMLAGGGGVTEVDPRASGGVDKIGQMEYILSQPLSYAKSVLICLKDYVLPRSADRYIENMAYLGQGHYTNIDLIVLAALAVLDRSQDYDLVIGRRIAVLFGGFLSILLAMTSMYIVFTPLKNETILGYQGRYIMPVLYPSIYVLFSVQERPKLRYDRIAATAYLWFAAAFLLCVWNYSVRWY